MKRLKSIITVITLCFFITVKTSSAFAPLVPYVAASVAIHLAAAAVGLYYAMKQSGESRTTSSTGDISRNATVTWVDLKSTPPQLVQKDVTATKTAAQVMDTAKKKQSTFPNLATAAKTCSNIVSDPEKIANAPTGSNVTVGGQNYLTSGTAQYVKAVSDTVKPAPSYLSGYIFSYVTVGPDGRVGWNGYTVYNQYRTAAAPATAPTPQYRDSTPQEFAGNIAASGTSGPTKSALNQEIDKMMQDPDYVPTFTDSTTGLPFSPPSGSGGAAGTNTPATPSEIDNYNRQGQQAQAAADAAGSTRAAWLNYSGNKTPGNYAAYMQAKANESNTAANNAGKDQQANDTAVSVPASGAAKTFSTAKFAQLKGALNSTYPFSVMGTIGNYYSVLSSGTNTAPTFTIKVLNHDYTIDLSIFDPVATTVRYLLAVVFTAGCGWYVVRFWRGVA